MKKLIAAIFIVSIFIMAFQISDKSHNNSESKNETNKEKRFTKPMESVSQSDQKPRRFTKPLDEEAEENENFDFSPAPFGTPLNSVVFTNLDVSQNPAPQNEMSVKISKKDPNRVVAAWRDFRQGSSPTVRRRIGYSYSTDGGTTWAASQLLDSTLLPGLPRNSDPAVCEDTSGYFYIDVIALTNSDGNGTLAVYRSTDGGVTFPTAKIVAQSGSEDKEYICCDWTPGSPFRNTLYTSWTRFSSTTGIFLTRSTNSGLNWSNPVSISDITSGLQGSDICVGKNGEVYVCWLDGNSSDDSIKFDKSTNGGLSFGVDKGVGGGAFPNIPITTSGVTFPSIATDISSGPNFGNIYITWSDARNGDPDIFLSRSTNGGTSWSPALRVNDDVIGNGKLQCWPWIAVSDSGRIVINYVDSRNTSVNTSFEMYMAKSTDGGLTFTNTLLSTAQSPSAQPNSAVRFGDYIGIDYWKNRIVPIWTDERAGGFDTEAYTSIINTLVNVIPVSTSVPDNYDLKQNYPNPFNPSTSIEFAIPVSGLVNIKVYDVLGKEVAQLVNEHLDAGTHKVIWNASALSSGIYVYKMISGGIEQTKRMMLVK